MEEERKDVLFRRSAFGGFRRNDVMKYIEQLQNELAQSKGESLKQAKLLEDYKRQNAEAVGNCMNSAKAAVEEVDRMLNSMSEQLAKVSAEKAELEKQMQQLREQMNSPAVTADDGGNGAEDRIAELMEQIEDLRARLKVETAANEILTNREELDGDDGFSATVEEETVIEETEEETETENDEKEVTVEEIEQIINRFLK